MITKFSNLNTLKYIHQLDDSAPLSIKQIMFSNCIKLCNRTSYVKFVNNDECHLKNIEKVVVDLAILYTHYKQSTILNYIEDYITDYLTIYNLEANASQYSKDITQVIQFIADLIDDVYDKL